MVRSQPFLLGVLAVLACLGLLHPSLTSKPALAQAPTPDCEQWMVAMFTANFSDYIRLDATTLEEETLQYSSVILPEGWEPLEVAGGLGALIPARRCLR